MRLPAVGGDLSPPGSTGKSAGCPAFLLQGRGASLFGLFYNDGVREFVGISCSGGKMR